MPWQHRWLGNPLLTAIGRLFYGAKIGDFHCGLRAFRRDAYEQLDLHTTGMEFASEMIIKASMLRMRITEIPTVLYKDGRSRPPHLHTWRDGWRHLRFMLLYSPRMALLTPGAILFIFGVGLSAWLAGGTRRVGTLNLDINTLLVASSLAIIGYQLIVFAVFTKIFAVREGFHPPSPRLNRMFRFANLEVGLLTGALLTIAGVVLLVAAVISWQAKGFGQLDPRVTMRQVIPPCSWWHWGFRPCLQLLSEHPGDPARRQPPPSPLTRTAEVITRPAARGSDVGN